MAGLARTCVLVLVSAAGAVTACGHLPFDDLPVEEDNFSSDAGLDGSQTSLDGGTGAGDGSLGTDGRPLDDGGRDGGFDKDAEADADARIPDAGCIECNILHVSAIGPDDGDGSIEKPLRKIQDAVNRLAQDTTKTEIHVAGGKYKESITIEATPLTLSGGYQCDNSKCDWTEPPDPINRPVFIEAQSSFAGLTVKEPADNKTVVRGIYVFGKNGALDSSASNSPGGAAVVVSGGTPTFESVFFEGGSVADGAAPVNSRRSIGLYVAKTTHPKELVIVRSTAALTSRLVGGTSNGGSVGLFLDGTARVDVRDTAIRSAKAPSSQAVFVRSSASESILEHNEIQAGPSTASNNEAQSWGVVIASSIRLFRNKINMESIDDTASPYCPTVTTPCGGVLTSDAFTTRIESNFIGGLPSPLSVGLLMAVSDGHASDVIVNGNYLRATGLAGSPNGLSAAIGLRVATGATKNVVGSVRNNILLGGVGSKRFGVLELPVPDTKGHLKALTNNDFWDIDAAYGEWDGANTTPRNESPSGGIPVAEIADNLNKPPNLRADGHLEDSSELISKGTMTEVTSTDIDDQPRPRGSAVDIGPDERGD